MRWRKLLFLQAPVIKRVLFFNLKLLSLLSTEIYFLDLLFF